MKSITLLLAFATIASSQLKAQVNLLVPVITKNSDGFTQSETGSVTHFEITATDKQISELKKNAENIAKSGSLELVKSETGIYKATLTITAQNHPEYVHKMFLHLGFEYFMFDGKKRPISELPAVLKSLK